MKVSVKDLNPGGKTTLFEIKIEFIEYTEQKVVEVKSGNATSTEDEEKETEVFYPAFVFSSD